MQIRGGQAPSTKSKSFKAAADKALEQYERDGRSKSYIHGLRKVSNVLNSLDWECGACQHQSSDLVFGNDEAPSKTKNV